MGHAGSRFSPTPLAQANGAASVTNKFLTPVDTAGSQAPFLYEEGAQGQAGAAIGAQIALQASIPEPATVSTANRTTAGRVAAYVSTASVIGGSLASVTSGTKLTA